MSVFNVMFNCWLAFVITDIIFTLIFKWKAKKTNYNCDKCKNSACYYHYCNKKRNELEEMKNKK